jgi:hypothetical protein
LEFEVLCSVLLCRTGTAVTVTVCLGGTGMLYVSGSGSGFETGFESGSNINVIKILFLEN